MARLSREDRQIALGRLQAGQSQSAIARHFHVSQSTSSRLWVRFQATGSVADLPRAGRPRATTAAHDRFIRLRHLRNRFLSASSSVQALPGPHRLSDQTVRNRLHEAGQFESSQTSQRSCPHPPPSPEPSAVGQPAPSLDRPESLETRVVQRRVLLPAPAT
ncbi:hypothetical protein V1264_006519 [Littorina saxatilis]|uniref:Insertion element IS150 protein InsJ-like helix-turn-helix domain-containing protein n=1 Tax=Littorina saxatilis TaxID=31220 RepID=A0AAN9G4C6_9CAEN